MKYHTILAMALSSRNCRTLCAILEVPTRSDVPWGDFVRLRRALGAEAAIEDYLAWCEADGAKPEKSWTGKLTLRSDEDFRRRLLIAAAARGQTVSAWINQLADRESRKIMAELENEA